MAGHVVSIAVRRLGPRFAVTVRDDHGSIGTGICDLASARGLDEALRAYRRLELGPRELVELGRRLLATLVLADPVSRDAWQRIRGAAGCEPLQVAVEFEPDTEPVWVLPLELLADEHGFLFARRGASLTRALVATSAKDFVAPARPRVLLAWATPRPERPFDPREHVAVLHDVFGAENVVVLAHATPESLEHALRNQSFDYLHLMVHGCVDWDGPLLVFDSGDGTPRPTGALRIANAVRETGVRFAFLCACSSAELADHPHFTGISAALVSDRGGDLAAVVAMQAPLLVAGSEDLVRSFHRRLQRSGDPTAAMTELRAEAGDATWSVPILLLRPRALSARAAHGRHYGAAAPLLHFVGRQEELASLTRAATDPDGAPVVALLGIGGLGKTSILYHWLRHDARHAAPPFEEIVSYCAYRTGAGFRHFLEFLFASLDTPQTVDPLRIGEAIARMAGLLRARRVVVAIDGLEAWLRGWKDGIGVREARLDQDREEGPAHRGLDEFLTACAALDGGSRLVVSSRTHPRALDGRRIAGIHSGDDPRGARLRGLRTADGVELLRLLNVHGDDDALAACVTSLDGHPLLLTLLADKLRHAGVERAASSALPRAVRALVETTRDESDSTAADLASFHAKLADLLSQLEVQRAADQPLLTAIAACFADAPRPAVERALGVEPGDLDLGHRLANLEKWGLLERYELDATSWLAVHPLVKQHFRTRVTPGIDRALGAWFAEQAVPQDSCTLRQAEPRIWAVSHFLRANDCDRACELLFAELAGGKALCEWFHAWGYLEYEIELERDLLGRCSKRWEGGIRRSLAVNLRTLGRIDEALDLLDEDDVAPDEASR